MIRCRSCDHSRWVYVKSGVLADELERLTGFIRYGCLACGHCGWHRMHRRPPALDDSRRAAAAVVSRVRAAVVAAGKVGVTAVAGTSRRLAATTAWPVMAIGLGAAVLLFTGVAIWLGLASPVTTDTRVPPLTAPLTPIKQAAPAPQSARPQAPTQFPLSRVAQPHPSAGLSAARIATTPPKSAPRQVAQVTAARDVLESRRRPSPTPVVQRQPEAAAPKPAAAAAAARKSSPATPRFHGALAVLSEPVGAVVSVDGRVVGATPLVLKNVPVGSRVVRIESQGYERWSFAARVVANQEVRIVATLQRASDQ